MIVTTPIGTPNNPEHDDLDKLEIEVNRPKEESPKRQNEKTPVQTVQANSPGFLSKITNYWWGSNSDNEKAAPVLEIVAQPKPIGFIPDLDVPSNFDPTLKGAKLPPSNPLGAGMSDEVIIEGLSQMSEATMETIMAFILKHQIELEHRGALITYDTLTKMQQMQKLQHKVLNDIKKTLEKDSEMSSYFNAGQKIAVAAGFISAFATVAASYGLGTVLANITNSIHPTVTAFSSAFFAVLPYFAAGLAATSIGGKSYYDVRSNEDKALLAEARHVKRVRQGHLIDWQNSLGERFEAKARSETTAIDGEKRREKLAAFVNRGRGH